MLWLFHYFQEKKMKTIILTVMAAIAISGCALFKENKTPLSPHGQLNACLRDEINQMTEDGRVVSLVAHSCLTSFKYFLNLSVSSLCCASISAWVGGIIKVNDGSEKEAHTPASGCHVIPGSRSLVTFPSGSW